MSEPGTGRSALIVWLVTDGKPGHENQSRGLAEALARATLCEVFTLPALPAWRAALAWLSKRFAGQAALAPDLIIGAGHRTHLTLLAARRARGGRAVVLMKPSLPRSCFDLCIVPQHDGIGADAHTLLTEGAINRVTPSAERDESRGLLLIGGTSPHFEWDSGAIQTQIRSIVTRTPEIRWTLTTSRRTPADFLSGVSPAPNLALVPHTQTSPEQRVDGLRGADRRRGGRCVRPARQSQEPHRLGHRPPGRRPAHHPLRHMVRAWQTPPQSPSPGGS